MRHQLCFLLALTALAAGSGLAFAAAAAQAAPPPLAVVQASAAAASNDDSDVTSAVDAGKRIGEIFKGWGSALLMGVAGLMGIGVLLKRSVTEGLTLLAIVVIIGGFVYPGDDVIALIESLWRPISGN